VADFRYLFYDWTSNQLLDSFRLESAALGWELNAPGTMTADVPLFDASLPWSRVGPATIPLRTKVFVTRDTELIWGGQIMEPRTYDSTTRQLTITAQETIGYFKSRFVPTLSLLGTDQTTIATTIIGTLEGQADGSAGLNINPALSGMLRDGTYSQYDFVDGLTALTDLTEVQGGLEFATRYSWSNTGFPSEELVLAYPRLGKVAPGQITTVLEYNDQGGGNIISYTWPEGPGLFTRTWADATTADGVQLDAKYDATALTDAGYPLLEQKVDFSSAKPATLPLLQAYANQQGAIVGKELVAATFDCKPDSDLVVGAWALGDDVRVRITDPRWPAGPAGQPGLDTYMRIVSAKVTTDSGGLEEYSFTCDNYWGLISQ
jgi:hypothetical protein